MARIDSHRARTAYSIVAALGGAATAADTHYVLGRVRQVTAHEVGHTLGMAHNYIASTYGRGSVMDYPAPRVTLTAGGNLDLSEAYAPGPGEYDVSRYAGATASSRPSTKPTRSEPSSRTVSAAGSSS